MHFPGILALPATLQEVPSISSDPCFRLSSHLHNKGASSSDDKNKKKDSTSCKTKLKPALSTSGSELDVKSDIPAVLRVGRDSGTDDEDFNDNDTATEFSWEYTIASSQQGTSSGRRGSFKKSTTGVAQRLSLCLSSKSGPRPGRRYTRPKARNQCLADLTVNKLQFMRLGRLYGREGECQLLEDAWHDVRVTWSRARSDPSTNNASAGACAGRRFVAISGASGTGKSALAETLRESVTTASGFFLVGKFPQRHRLVSRHAIEPYVAFESACNELCELIISLYSTEENEETGSTKENRIENSEEVLHHGFADANVKVTLSQFRELLDKEVGADASILTRVIPGLLQILKTDNCGSFDDAIGYREAHHRFKFAFRRFLRAVASVGPIVLVLDDLQWADAASMELLDSLVSDRECKGLLIIGCYRDEKEYAATPYLHTLESARDLDDNSFQFDQISIGNLGVSQVHELLVDLLSLSEPETSGLASCVHRKTLGNIFFVIQFVTMLEDSGLLVYNIGSLKWTFDVSVIQVSTEATDNVANLVTDKMKRLPTTIQRMLPIMACLGTAFRPSVFELLLNHFVPLWNHTVENFYEETSASLVEKQHAFDDRPTPKECLTSCESEGLIYLSLVAGENRYQWVHDKIQEAALLLISDAALANLKREIGKVLFEQLDFEQVEKNLFTIINLLTVECPQDSPRSHLAPIEVAKICLRAGVKTIDNSAFDEASRYLAAGVRLLPSNHWEDHYELSLELFSTAAEAEFCLGNFELMQEYCNAVLDQPHCPLLDKRRIYNVMIDCTAAEQGMGAAFTLCNSILLKLGCRFPNRAVNLHVLAGILRVKATLKRCTASETILRLPIMDDELHQWMMTLLDKLTTYAYLSNPALLPLVIFKGLRLTLSQGISDYSPPMFAFVGLLLAAFVSDYKGGQAFANQAIDLLKLVKHSRKVESRVLFLSHAFVLHWMRPVSQSIKPLLASFEVGMAVGDTESAGWSIYFHLEYSFRTGSSLPVLLADCAFYAGVMREVKQKTNMLYTLSTLWQSILHLTGANPYPGSLTGDIMNQGEALRQISTKDYECLHCAIHRMLMYVAFVFGKHSTVYQSMCDTKMHKGSYGSSHDIISVRRKHLSSNRRVFLFSVF